MTNTELIRQEIENIALFPTKSADYNDGREDMKMMILDTIDSLQQERPEVDLEKEVEKCLKQYNMLAVGKKDFTEIARHFYELGINAKKEE